MIGEDIFKGNRDALRIDIDLVLAVLGRYVGRVSSRFRPSWNDLRLLDREMTF